MVLTGRPVSVRFWLWRLLSPVSSFSPVDVATPMGLAAEASAVVHLTEARRAGYANRLALWIASD